MDHSRRDFLKRAGLLAGAAAVAGPISQWLVGCSTTPKPWHFEISLAQWSLHKDLFDGKIRPEEFPIIAGDQLGFSAVEYVNQFFFDKAKDKLFLKQLQANCKWADVQSLLIMIDNEGSVSDLDKKQQLDAIDNHKKWVEMGAELGCHSIRINLHGHGNERDWIDASAQGLGQLAEFCDQFHMNVIVENHGQLSSRGDLLAAVMRKVNMHNCGTLPDFGNFCVARRDGDLWASPCIEEYDKYKGVEEMMPYAKGVSAKAFDFDENGNETTIDFKRMLEIVKNAGYRGHIGVEYEGGMDPYEGIAATKNLLERLRGELA